MGNKITNLLKFVIGWPFALISFFFLIAKFIAPNFTSLISKITQINIFFVLYSLVFFFAYFLLRAYSWHLILLYRGYKMRFSKVSFLWAYSELRRYVPGFIWSFIGRTMIFEKEGVERKEILSSLVTEGQLILISSLFLSASALPFIFQFFFPGLTFKFIPLVFLILFLILILFIFQKGLLLNKSKTINKIKSFLFSSFSKKGNFYLLSVSLLSFVAFGLGAYFSVSSFVYLDPGKLPQFFGIFVLSFFVGYAAFFIPTGLGVREGIVTFALSKVMSSPFAAFSAVIFRVVLVIAEVIFLTVIYGTQRIRARWFGNILRYISTHKQGVIALFLTLLFIVYFCATTTLRYENFYTGRYDLGNMDQTIWNTMRGRIFQTNSDSGQIISRLSAHADFILILIAPLYKVWADPRLLLILQTIVLAAGAYFVFKITEYVLKDKNLALLFTFVYLINPSIQSSDLYDFHAVVLATTFLLAMFYFALRQKLWPFLLFLFLTGITKEEIWLVTGLLALFYLYTAKKEKINLSALKKVVIIGSAIASFIAFYLLIWHIIPAFRNGQHFALAYYSDFGDTPTKVVKNIFLSPVKTITTIITLQKLRYLLQLSLPLGFLPLLGLPFLIFAAPDLLINLLSNNTQFTQITYQYTAAITPFLVIASIYGVKLLREKAKLSILTISLFLLFFAILAAYAYGPLPGAREPNLDMITKPTPNKELISAFLNQIPKNLSISATNNLGSHLSRRQKLYTVPIGVRDADVVVFLLNDRFAQPSLAAQIKTADSMKQDKKYVEVFKSGDFVAFEKRDLYLQKKPTPRQVPLFPLSVPVLEERSYEPKNVEIGSAIYQNSNFEEHILSYESDGLMLRSLITVPKSDEPSSGFPVIVVDHGYIDPKEYSTTQSYAGITNYFANKGFIVLKPDYRGNAESEADTNQTLRRFEYPIDVMNLIVSLDNIPQADKNSVFIWGHSMGGEVTLKTLEILGKKQDIDIKVKGAVLWAPVTDTVQWFSTSHAPTLPEYISGSENLNALYRALGTPSQNPFLWQSLSPLPYLSDIQVPVEIFHGSSDTTVPSEWSIELYNDLKTLGKTTTLAIYPGDDHNLSNSFSDAAEKNVSFFKSLLNNK